MGWLEAIVTPCLMGIGFSTWGAFSALRRADEQEEHRRTLVSRNADHASGRSVDFPPSRAREAVSLHLNSPFGMLASEYDCYFKDL